MGIHSRDYIRDEHGPSRFGGDGVATACKTLIIVTVAVFVLQLLTLGISKSFPPDVQKYVPVVYWLKLSPDTLVHGQIWRLVTYAFCHDVGDLLHIVFNMLFLWWFGKTLELMYGSGEFLAFYLTSAAVSGLTFVVLALAMHQSSGVVGASGAIMAVMMVYAMYFPRQRIYIWGVIPIEIRWLIIAYIIFDLLPVLQQLAGSPGGDGVAHAAHLGGLAFGFIYKKYDIRLKSLYSRMRLPKFGRFFGPRRKIRIYEPAPVEREENIDAQVDSILEKISREGEASLTDSEREILKKASQKYKRR